MRKLLSFITVLTVGSVPVSTVMSCMSEQINLKTFTFNKENSPFGIDMSKYNTYNKCTDRLVWSFFNEAYENYARTSWIPNIDQFVKIKLFFDKNMDKEIQPISVFKTDFSIDQIIYAVFQPSELGYIYFYNQTNALPIKINAYKTINLETISAPTTKIVVNKEDHGHIINFDTLFKQVNNDVIDGVNNANIISFNTQNIDTNIISKTTSLQLYAKVNNNLVMLDANNYMEIIKNSSSIFAQLVANQKNNLVFSNKTKNITISLVK